MPWTTPYRWMCGPEGVPGLDALQREGAASLSGGGGPQEPAEVRDRETQHCLPVRNNRCVSAEVYMVYGPYGVRARMVYGP